MTDSQFSYQAKQLLDNAVLTRIRSDLHAMYIDKILSADVDDVHSIMEAKMRITVLGDIFIALEYMAKNYVDDV